MSALKRSFLSRVFPRRGHEQHNAAKGPLGLTTLHALGPDQPAVADLVFVHGLNGGSQSTWTEGNDPALFWPKEWLPEEDGFHDVGIHTFGYPSAISRRSVLDIRDFARSLLTAIKDSPVMNRGEEPRLIFVAHSMGGLVVKEAYILARQDPEFQSVGKRVCSIVFLATPHQGAAMADTLANVMALAPGGVHPFVHDLSPSSAILRAINDQFPKLCGDLELRSFFETRPMNVATRRALIVEKHMAVMNLPNERRALLNADHRHVAMYASRNDSSFRTVRNALAAVISSQRDSLRLHKREADREDRAALSRFLGVSDAPEDDLMVYERLPGTCEWLAGKDYFKSWVGPAGPGFLWLRGRPGAGKSMLAGHVVHDLRDRGADSCFFFFKTGDATRSTVSAFLKSIAWQMAALNPAVMSKIKEFTADGKDGAADWTDANVVWRKLYVSTILTVKLERPQYWVIDSIDESNGGVDLMAFLTRIREHWPLSVLITSRDPAEAYLGTANRQADVRSHVMSEEDNKQDIALFVRANIKIHRFHTAARWISQEEMAAQIVDNSGGCFLWASLVCSELRKETGEKEIKKVLGSVPSDMDALYSRILVEMESAQFGKHLAKAFIAWTTHAFRPLGTAEIQEAIEMDIDDKIDDVERVISKCCGSLLYVDANSRVRLIHATAREFLSRKDLESQFVVTKAEGHRRLAAVCLEFLAQTEKILPSPSRSSSRLENGGPVDVSAPASTSTATPQSASFTHYASTYLFQHLSHVSPTDDDIFIKLSEFLGSPRLLRWIEFIATHGDLSTVYQAGRTIKSLLSRRARNSSPSSLTPEPRKPTLLDQWGDDLVHLVTKFSRQLKSSPRSIHNLIPPFCPSGSAIRQQHSAPSRGIDVQGLSERGWDDCLATITYPKGMKPNAVAAGPLFFAIGMRNPNGDIDLYDDVTLQKSRSLSHAEPVWRMEFSESGRYLASAGPRRVRIWSPADGTEVSSFLITSLCVAIGFESDDSILRVVTRENALIEWELRGQCFLHSEPATWAADLEEPMQFRTPTLAALNSASGILAVIYRGENILLWEYAADRIYDIYEKDTGSVAVYGYHKLAEGATTVRAVAFSHSVDTNRLAATYADGDLVVYDTTSGKATAAIESANTLLMSSSRDGRILAGADSAGNLTLFEFETLRPLYRVRFDTPVLPRDLTFTSDSRRIVEIRGQQCRVWEPSVLLCVGSPDDEDSSDAMSGPTGRPGEVDSPTTATINISAIACCVSSSVVFVTREDGTVAACDIASTPASQVLFVQTSGFPIHLLSFDEASSTLACADLTTRVTARRVVRRRAPRQPVAWEVSDDVLVDILTGGPGQVKQILVSGGQSRLLVSTEESATLWQVPKQGGPAQTIRVSESGGSGWLAHPTRADQLLCVNESGVNIFSWTDLDPVRVVRLSFNSSFARLVPLQDSRFFATTSREEDGHLRVQLWDCTGLEAPPMIMAATSDLDFLSSSSSVEHIVGAFAARLVVYTADHWIASVDLARPSMNTFVRHFFVPADWTSSRQLPIFGIGRSGEVLLAKQSELAVIKRGLEGTESGERFHPRVSRPASRRRGGAQ